MTKSVIAGIVALVLVLGCGIAEVVCLRGAYQKLHEQCAHVIDAAENKTLTEEQFDIFRQNWVKLRETSELFLPHQDVYELNLRFAEAQAFAKQQDFAQLLSHLSVIEELLSYVPHLMTPDLNHLV